MSDKVISSTTQEFLDVYDIVNDMVLLKDGSAATILQVGTMNFSLLAEQEQDAVIFTYGSVLNSLNYPIQINIQSQTKDATKYLRLLDEQIAKASSERKANLIKQYRGFVEGLIKERNVLQKRFYIVAPASPGEMGLIAPSSVLPGKGTFNIESIEKSILLEKATNILEPRVDHLTSQFNRLGLFARRLTTQEIIQNFYINYNPEAAEGQEISSSENYTTPLVRASFGGKFMQLNNIMQNQAAAQGKNQPVQTQTQPQAQPQAPAAVLPETPVAPAPTQAELPVQDSIIAPETMAAPEATTAPEIASAPVATAEISPATEPTMQQNQVFPPTEQSNLSPEYSPAAVEPAPAPEPTSAPEPIPTEETIASQPTPTANLDLNLDPSLLSGSAPTKTIASAPDQLSSMPDFQPQPSEVFAETPGETAAQQAPPENIPVIETAPIIEETNLAAQPNPGAAPEAMVEPAVAAAPIAEAEPTVSVPATPEAAAPAPTEPAPTEPTPTAPATTTEPDFSEEITPLQIQDDAKNV